MTQVAKAMQPRSTAALRIEGKAEARRRFRNPDLTQAERDTLLFVCKGLSDRESARLLCKSHHTIRDCMKRVLAKLDVDTRIEAAVHAAKAGWV